MPLWLRRLGWFVLLWVLSISALGLVAPEFFPRAQRHDAGQDREAGMRREHVETEEADKDAW